MHPFIIYLIQVNIALVLFFLIYTLLFKRDTFLHLRRLYFISAIVFSLLYPMFVVPGLSDVFNFIKDEPKTVETSVFFEAPTMGMIIDDHEEAVNSFIITWKQILSVFYIAGTLFFIFRFLWQLISIFRIRLKSEKVSVSDVEVYNLKDDITPFSFFGMIFINSKMHSEEELEQIIIHEHTHVREKHSLDIMLIETVLLFSWWNPFVWFMKREMSMNLEYLADKGVLTEGVDSRDYQYHLLRLTYHETAVQIVNNFNVSQLKQRIMMMNKSRSSTLKLAKYLLMLPMFFILIAANSVYAGENEQNVTEPPPVKKESTVKTESVDEIFEDVEEEPEYPGGTDALLKFLADNIVYPAEAKDKGIQGRVICNFVLTKDGNITEVNIVRGVDPQLDAEAVRVIESMPKWKPGRHRGNAVNVRFFMPVTFKFDSEPLSEEKMQELQRMKDSVVEAKFTGGEDAYMKYLAENIRYPVIALENGIQGLVVARYRILSTGKVDFIDIVEGVDPSLEKEVQRLIDQMPDWTPTKIDGEATTSVMNLPVIFKIEGEEVNSYDGPALDNAVIVVGYGYKKTP